LPVGHRLARYGALPQARQMWLKARW
jgi:hypothetical protein